MSKPNIDFNALQKAMEDLSREAFDYFLDTRTDEIIILSEDIINKAREILNEAVDDDMADYEEVEFDEDYDIPEWMDEEIELALDIFIFEKDRYKRIPERDSRKGFAAMKEFTDSLEDRELKEDLQNILDGKGAFRKFKDALESYPKERKLWYGFNAKAARQEMAEWLQTIEAEYVKSRDS